MNGSKGVSEARWWASLRHVGLLLSPREVVALDAARPVPPLAPFQAEGLQRELVRFAAGSTPLGELVSIVLESVCGLPGEGWLTGPRVGPEHSRVLVSGAPLRPRRIWTSPTGGYLPVFVDEAASLAHGRGRKVVAEVLQWLRAARRPLALLTNGRQWRLIYAGLDYEAACESTTDLWFEGGEPGPQLEALRRLLQPALHSPEREGESSPLVAAILASRQGQSELSASLGERVREAVELLIGAHGEAISASDLCDHGGDVYRAAVRLVMRLVVLLFAESRDLLPRANPIYEGGYGLQGLFEALERAAARGRGRLEHRHGAWPRLLALFRLVHEGSAHEALPVPAYGGELFAPGDPASPEALSRALALFESACFDSTRQPIADRVVHDMLQLLTRSKVRVRQGRTTTTTVVPVDFSDLSSEYIGILYEGLLDYELRQAPADDPIVFLAVGDEPALPLSRLEAMADREIASLFEKLKQKKGATAEEEGGGEDGTEEPEATEEASEGEADVEPLEPGVDEVTEEDSAVAEASEESAGPSPLELARTRALQWTQRACVAGGLVTRPRGRLTAERELALTQEIERTAKQLVRRVIQPGEWYLVRWGGTRKGAGTFYTRPQLAVPLAQRTLRPLAYEATATPESESGSQAAPAALRPKPPEAILALQVCDPACGSGSFLVAALRFLTEAVYESLFAHGRLAAPDRPFDELLGLANPGTAEGGGATRLPCRPDDPDFEERTRALLRRYVVERCLYGVDLDPLAVELCRLSLWVETMDRDLPFSFLDHKVKCGNSLVGAWFDQFQHYPVTAWKDREGGDKNHNNGVHFEREARTKAIKAFVRERLTPDLQRFLAGRTLFSEDMQEHAASVHAETAAALAQLHNLPVQDAAERAHRYRDQLLGSAAYRALRSAMDLWCACWFWPPEDLDCAPLPSSLAQPPAATQEVAERVATRHRFFHWELEFPDVFREAGSGFDAVLGNPPWENLQPNPEEFFSNADPLFRTYGRLVKLGRQQELFGSDPGFEKRWLDYSAAFNNFSHWVSHVANPFGDPEHASVANDSFAIGRGGREAHARWRSQRELSRCYASQEHPFRYQMGRLFTYKLFLEQCHALLRVGGRLGQLVPSGIYSDAWSQPLRQLFLDRCRWEWLFGFENREGIFAIHRSFKFNPVIVEKGGTTVAIRTAFMRRKLADWARAEELAVTVSIEDISSFSPGSRAILEIPSPEDLEILRAIVSRGVRLGATSAATWDLTYSIEFMSNLDAALFPPLTQWQDRGFSRSEYSVWLGPDGSRALPLLEGRMVGQFDPTQKGWVSGKGRGAVWQALPFPKSGVSPQYLIRETDYLGAESRVAGLKLHHMQIASATNERTTIAVPLRDTPSLESAPSLVSSVPMRCLPLAAVLNSFAFDYQMRFRCSGLHLTWHILEDCSLPPVDFEGSNWAGLATARLSWAETRFAADWLRLAAGDNRAQGSPWKMLWAVTEAERVRLRTVTDVIVAAAYGLGATDLSWALRHCDFPTLSLLSRSSPRLDPKGFWRVDKEKGPELRHTVLTLVAFHDLEAKIREQGGDREKGIAAFCAQNDGEGWMLPETLCLADYGLGHDERAKHPQPVASRLGPRFYDWQLAQGPEESWRECHLHARNLLGEEGYGSLLKEIEIGSARSPDMGGTPPQQEDEVRETAEGQSWLFPKQPGR